MSDRDHTCGLRGCEGTCDCGGYGFLIPGKTIDVCRCKRHLYAELDAAKWTCATCGRENFESWCECQTDMFSDMDAPTRGFLGDAAW